MPPFSGLHVCNGCLLLYCIYIYKCLSPAPFVINYFKTLRLEHQPGARGEEGNLVGYFFFSFSTVSFCSVNCWSLLVRLVGLVRFISFLGRGVFYFPHNDKNFNTTLVSRPRTAAIVVPLRLVQQRRSNVSLWSLTNDSQ